MMSARRFRMAGLLLIAGNCGRGCRAQHSAGRDARPRTRALHPVAGRPLHRSVRLAAPRRAALPVVRRAGDQAHEAEEATQAQSGMLSAEATGAAAA